MLHQSRLVQKLKDKFECEIQDMRVYNSPISENMHVVRAKNYNTTLEHTTQKDYQSGTGTLLYITNISCPKIANSVRELTKVMDRATVVHYKNMLCVINFVIDTNNWGIEIHKEIELTLNLQCYVDSNLGGDPY